MKFRPANKTDEHFIIDSFIHEYCKLHSVSTAVIWHKIVALLLSPDWQCLVATSDDDTTEIMGYLIYKDQNTLGWLHVKKQYRSFGVASALFHSADICKGSLDVAFFSPPVAKWAKVKGYTLRWRPYLPDVEELALAHLILELDL